LESVEVTVGVMDCSSHYSQPLQGLFCSRSLSWLILQAVFDQDNHRVTLTKFLVKDVDILASTLKLSASYHSVGVGIMVSVRQKVIWKDLNGCEEGEMAEGEHI